MILCKYCGFSTVTAPCRYLRAKIMPPSTPTRRKKDYRYLVYTYFSLPSSRSLAWSSGIMNTTRTALGRSLLRTWFIRPSLSLQVLQARHDAVECFLRAENLPVVSALQSQLQGITNIPKTLGFLRSGKGKISDWQALVKVRPFRRSRDIDLL